MMAPLVHLFVYGTLKEGFPNHHVNEASLVAGTWQTDECFPLYLVGERFVPWMINLPGEGCRVSGELYAADDQMLTRMDTLEQVGLPQGYERIAIDVTSTEGEQRTVQAYLKAPAQLADARSRNLLRSEMLAAYEETHAADYRPRN